VWGKKKKERFINYRQMSGLLSLLRAVTAAARSTPRATGRAVDADLLNFRKNKNFYSTGAKWPPLETSKREL